MHIRVSATEFKGAISRLCSGKKEALINIVYYGGMLSLQLVETAMLEEIQVVCSNKSDIKRESITVLMPKIVKILKNAEFDIEMTKDMMIISQNMFNLTLIKEVGERVNIKFEESNTVNINVNSIKAFNSVAMSLEVNALRLGMSPPHIECFEGRGYIQYMDVWFIGDIGLPDCKIAASTLKLVSNSLSKESTGGKATYNNLNNVLTIGVRSRDRIQCALSECLGMVKDDVKSVIDSCTSLHSISVEKFESEMQELVSNIGDVGLDLSFCKDSMRVTAQSINSSCTVGSEGKAYLSIKIIASQLISILKVFGKDTDVKVLKGGKYICLLSEEKTIILSGTSY